MPPLVREGADKVGGGVVQTSNLLTPPLVRGGGPLAVEG